MTTQRIALLILKRKKNCEGCLKKNCEGCLFIGREINWIFLWDMKHKKKISTRQDGTAMVCRISFFHICSLFHSDPSFLSLYSFTCLFLLSFLFFFTWVCSHQSPLPIQRKIFKTKDLLFSGVAWSRQKLPSHINLVLSCEIYCFSFLIIFFFLLAPTTDILMRTNLCEKEKKERDMWKRQRKKVRKG